MEMKLSIVRTIIGAVLILLADGPQSEVSGQTGQWMRVDIVQLLPDRLDDYLEFYIFFNFFFYHYCTFST